MCVYQRWCVYSAFTVALLINQTALRLCRVPPQISPQDQVFTETVTLRSFQLEIRRTLLLCWACVSLCRCVCVLFCTSGGTGYSAISTYILFQYYGNVKSSFCSIASLNDFWMGKKIMYFNVLAFFSPPTQICLCFCLSPLCVFVYACLCLRNFLSACLPVSLLVRARGMTGVGSISILLQGFWFHYRSQMGQEMQGNVQGGERENACNVAVG